VLLLPEVPLAHGRRGVVGGAQVLRQRGLVEGQTAHSVSIEDAASPLAPGAAPADGNAAGEDRAARRRADVEAGVELRKAQAGGGQGVQVRRAGRGVAVEAQVAYKTKVGGGGRGGGGGGGGGGGAGNATRTPLRDEREQAISVSPLPRSSANRINTLTGAALARGNSAACAPTKRALNHGSTRRNRESRLGL
jgi:hypothetical protein